MPKTALVTFDLQKENLDYKTAYAILAKMNLFPITPGIGDLFLNTPDKRVTLPNTTVMGTIQDSMTAEGLRDLISLEFKAAGVDLTCIVCGLVGEWAATGRTIS